MNLSPRANSVSTIGALAATASPSPKCVVQKDSFTSDVGKPVATTDPTMLGGQVTVSTKAAFAGGPNKCKFCEYRQLIRGYQEYTNDRGQILGNPAELAPGVFVSRTDYHEDGGRDKDISNKWYRPGHRRDLPPADNTPYPQWHYGLDDTYSPAPRLTGCSYSTKDVVKFEVPKSLKPVSVRCHAEFKGQIWEVDEDGNIVGSAPVAEITWTVDFHFP